MVVFLIDRASQPFVSWITHGLFRDFLSRGDPVKRRTSKRTEGAEVVGFVGVGLNNQDEHKRITQSEHFVLLGGSEETHERMQDTVLRFEEALKRTGKPLSETPPEKAVDLLREAMDP
jgi:hypothetical protein